MDYYDVFSIGRLFDWWCRLTLRAPNPSSPFLSFNCVILSVVDFSIVLLFRESFNATFADAEQGSFRVQQEYGGSTPSPIP